MAAVKAESIEKAKGKTAIFSTAGERAAETSELTHTILQKAWPNDISL